MSPLPLHALCQGLLMLAATVPPLAVPKSALKPSTPPSVASGLPAVPSLIPLPGKAAAQAAPTSLTTSSIPAVPMVKKNAKPAPHAVKAAALHATPTPAPVKEWWFRPHKDHTPSGGPTDIPWRRHRISFLGDASRKVVYLTFDAGYDTGHLGHILDALKAEKVQANFFVTRYFMKESPAMLRRMVAEGHTIGNHTATHPTGLSAKGEQRIKDEILWTAEYYKKLTGREMPLLFRPPSGECDDRILNVADQLGWRTVFWSMAYADWLPKQKGAQFAVDHVAKYSHPGAIILLHPFASNSEALGTIIGKLKREGYAFGSLAELKDEPVGPATLHASAPAPDKATAVAPVAALKVSYASK